MGLYNRFCKRFFAAVIIRLTAQSDSRAHEWTNYSTRRSFDKNVNHICCAAFLKPVSFQAHSQHHKDSIYHCCGCLGDMWRARVLFWGAPLQDADQLRVFFCLQVTVGTFLITMVNFNPSMPHPRSRQQF